MQGGAGMQGDVGIQGALFAVYTPDEVSLLDTRAAARGPQGDAGNRSPVARLSSSRRASWLVRPPGEMR